jgi:hypothetical protein
MNRRFAVLMAFMAVSCAGAMFAACSGDNGGGGGGTDAGPDHSVTDAHPGNDSPTQDSTTPETGPTEGGNEGSANEGGGHEGGHEGGVDASDGGDAGDAGDAGDGGPSACQLFDASTLDEASVAAGFVQVWQTYKCWKCHQDTSKNPVDDAGVGIVLNGNAAGLGDSGTIFPPNLTNSAQGLGCWSDQQIATAILQGKDLEGGTLCPPMPVFDVGDGSAGRPMDAGTAQEIIDYIRSLPASANTVPEMTCSATGTDGGDGGGDSGEDGGDSGDSGGDAAADAPTDSPVDAGGQ